MNRIITAISFFLLSLSASLAQDLKFGKDGKFRIVQFTDIHIVPEKAEASDIAVRNLNSILDQEKPDLVIITGDLIFGKPAEPALDKALQPLIDHKVPYAVVWGNHDDEQDVDRRGIYDYIKGKPYNLTQTTEGISRVTNYVLPIMSSDGGKQSYTLYMIDSGAYSDMKTVKGYAWIKDDQIRWFRQNSRRIRTENNNDTIPAMAFFHIPLPEFKQASMDDSAKLVGSRMEKVCSPELNSGLFNAILEEGDVMGVFVGHDHDNDYAVLYKNILLAYGRYSGGKTVYNNLPGGNGARIIELKEGKREFTTYIRLCTGEKLNEVKYPSSFGK